MAGGRHVGVALRTFRTPDGHRGADGFKPICKMMPIAPSTYWLHAQRQARPELRPDRSKRDDVLAHEVRRAWPANMQIYGVRKGGVSFTGKGRK